MPSKPPKGPASGPLASKPPRGNSTLGKHASLSRGNRTHSGVSTSRASSEVKTSPRSVNGTSPTNAASAKALRTHPQPPKPAGKPESGATQRATPAESEGNYSEGSGGGHSGDGTPADDV